MSRFGSRISDKGFQSSEDWQHTLDRAEEAHAEGEWAAVFEVFTEEMYFDSTRHDEAPGRTITVWADNEEEYNALVKLVLDSWFHVTAHAEGGPLTEEDF